MIVCLSFRYTAEPHLVNIVSLNPQILTCTRQYANFSHTFAGGVRTTFVISDNQFCNSDNLWKPDNEIKNSDNQFCNSPLWLTGLSITSKGELSSQKQMSWTTMYLHSNTHNSTKCNLIIGCLRVDRAFGDYCSLQGSLYLVFLCCSICIGSRLTFVLYLPRQFVHFSTPCLQPIGEECKLQIASQLHTHPQSTFILSNSPRFSSYLIC